MPGDMWFDSDDPAARRSATTLTAAAARNIQAAVAAPPAEIATRVVIAVGLHLLTDSGRQSLKLLYQ